MVSGKSPREPTHLNVMRRYQLSHPGHGGAGGRRQTGRGTADACPAGAVHQNCARIIDGIHLNVLTAIALHRKRDEGGASD